MTDLNAFEIECVEGAGIVGAVIGGAIGSVAGPGGTLVGAVAGHFIEETIKEITAD